MPNKFELVDYEPVTRSSLPRHSTSAAVENDWKPLRAVESILVAEPVAKCESEPSVVSGNSASAAVKSPLPENWLFKRGHGLSYAGVFAFTFLVYFRPYELFPSLTWLSKSAFVVAVTTLAVFIPAQLGLENRITARPREVKLVIALLVTGLLSIPLALEPPRAVQSFIEFFKVVAMFIVMVNVLRTEKRLKALIQLVLFASCVLSLAALTDYAQGNLALQGRRIAGLIGGLFSNPNDLALHLVTMIPISLGLFLGSRGVFSKVFYLISALLLTAGMVATFSRGGFLGFMFVTGFLVWKLARRNRVIFGALAITVVLAAIALAPGAYRSRIATTSDASAVARTDDLKRSILVAARHPLFGVGMDNYILYSNVNKATHNAYTQVASEIGFAGLLFYLGFLITPFNRLRSIVEASTTVKRKPSVYYLAIGLQASLVGYMVVSFFASVAYLWYAYYLVAYAICLRRLCSVSPEDKHLASDLRLNRKEALNKRDQASMQSAGTQFMGGN
jgi:putative inorganic carbon (hco3(-)) transporter